MQRRNAPQDPDLYGQRPSKKAKRGTTVSSSLDFSAQLASLISAPSSSTARPAKTSKIVSSALESLPAPKEKSDLFRKTKKSKPEKAPNNNPLNLKNVTSTEEETLERDRARRKMEDKARLYAAMKRGDYVAKENEAAPLIDFDRKWAETKEQNEDEDLTSSDEDEGPSKAGDDEIIEYTDEFGRQRTGTRKEIAKLERAQMRSIHATSELTEMSARPQEPTNIIYGDAIQSMAFTADDPDKMSELAAKRDRSATPPGETHYDADWEIRTKGTGFYKFSKDEGERRKAMEGLEEERLKTEEQRGEKEMEKERRETDKEKRRRDMEERRKAMSERRAKKQADSFLDGL